MPKQCTSAYDLHLKGSSNRLPDSVGIRLAFYQALYDHLTRSSVMHSREMVCVMFDAYGASLTMVLDMVATIVPAWCNVRLVCVTRHFCGVQSAACDLGRKLHPNVVIDYHVGDWILDILPCLGGLDVSVCLLDASSGFYLTEVLVSQTLKCLHMKPYSVLNVTCSVGRTKYSTRSHLARMLNQCIERADYVAHSLIDAAKFLHYPFTGTATKGGTCNMLFSCMYLVPKSMDVPDLGVTSGRVVKVGRVSPPRPYSRPLSYAKHP
jgi:hypothetical protein